MTDNRLRVGIIGAGEVAQVIHLPALAMLSHLYITTAVCDISKKVRINYSNAHTHQMTC
jgi:predicted dehydrogenase